MRPFLLIETVHLVDRATWATLPLRRRVTLQNTVRNDSARNRSGFNNYSVTVLRVIAFMASVLLSLSSCYTVSLYSELCYVV
jgi:hypothetical protein